MSAKVTRTFLLRMQFLGFRYHGWQHQPGQRTIEGMLRKTLHYVLPGYRVKLLGAGRTDARVSALDFAAQLTVEGDPEPIPGPLLEAMNANLPPDIRLLSLETVNSGFNVIRDCSLKIYHYRFCFGSRPHPFAAPLSGYFRDFLDIPAMAEAARLFEGTHDFQAFIAGATEEARVVRTLAQCRLIPHTEADPALYPAGLHRLEVGGKGFGRYQVRLMMGALADIGRGAYPAEQLSASLDQGKAWPGHQIAPASGLCLFRTEFARSTT